MGFATSKADSSLFIWKTRLGPISILLYVDDLVITGADLEEINRAKRQLAASFEMKDLGDLHYFLGIKVIRTPEGILMSQRHYALSMLFKFGMAECKPISTPLDRTVNVPNLRGRVEPELEPELEREPESELEADRSENAESESGVEIGMTNQPSPGRAQPPE
jgi:hypothetical protein